MATWIGRYRVSALLGVGGLGPLYRAHDEQVGRSVALRVIPPAATGDPACRAAVLETARRVSALSHPFIGMLFDVVTEPGAEALAFEYVHGVPLVPRTPGGAPDVRHALDITGAIAQALAHAHERGITHRDVRPHNILLSARGRPKLVETGFAAFTRGASLRRALARDPDGASDEARAIAPYVSPEEVVGQDASASSDVFSLGVVFYELLTGALPFEAAGVPDLLVRVASEEPLPPRSRNPRVPPSVEALVLGCLARSPRSRLTAQAVATRTVALLAALQDG
jgi:serine/threonine-protein kinase